MRNGWRVDEEMLVFAVTSFEQSLIRAVVFLARPITIVGQFDRCTAAHFQRNDERERDL